MSDTETINAPAGFEDGSAFEPETPAAAPEVVETPAAPAEPETAAEPVAAAPEPAAVPAGGQRVTSIDEAIQQRDGIYRDLKSERQRASELAQENARLKGQLEGIELQQRRGSTPQGPQPLTPAETAKATTWAHRLGMYTADGQPDVLAAHNALNELKQEFSGEVDARVQQRVQPVVQVLQNAHAQAKVAQIVQIGQQFGADPTLLQTYATNLAAVQPDALDDQNVIVGLIGLSRGMSSLAQPQTPAKPAAPTTPASPVVIPAPNVTERPGQRTTVAPSLSGIERVIAQKRGMNNETWAQRSKEFEQMDPTRGLVAEKD